MAKKNDRSIGMFKSLVLGLKSSYLVMFLAALFAADLAFPDPLPFFDESVLFLVTVLLARWKGVKQAQEDAEEAEATKPPPKDITPPAETPPAT